MTYDMIVSSSNDYDAKSEERVGVIRSVSCRPLRWRESQTVSAKQDFFRFEQTQECGANMCRRVWMLNTEGYM